MLILLIFVFCLWSYLL